MPASLLELKKKIASVKQTGKITEAMRMVSASNKYSFFFYSFKILSFCVRIILILKYVSSKIINPFGSPDDHRLPGSQRL